MKSTIFFLTAWVLLFSACKEKKKYHDMAQKEKVEATTDALANILTFQQELNAKFKDPETSPLPDRYRKNFERLDFFAPDTSYVVEAKFIRTPESLPFLMPTSTDRKSKEVVYGIAQFTLNNEKWELEVYQNEELIQEDADSDYLFMPFTDDTNDNETYGGGRYIDLRIPNSTIITIDFNTAYNPYCAYNKKFSCPIVPSINNLGTEVRAGVKAFHPNPK